MVAHVRGDPVSCRATRCRSRYFLAFSCIAVVSRSTPSVAPVVCQLPRVSHVKPPLQKCRFTGGCGSYTGESDFSVDWGFDGSHNGSHPNGLIGSSSMTWVVYLGWGHSAPNMTGQKFHRTAEVIPRRPWKSKSPFVSKPIKTSITRGRKGREHEVRRGSTVLLPFISIVSSLGRPVVLAPESCGSSHGRGYLLSGPTLRPTLSRYRV